MSPTSAMLLRKYASRHIAIASSFYALIPRKIRSRDRAIGVDTRLRAGRPRNRGPIPGRGKGLSSFPKKKSQTGSGTHPASYSMDNASEADHSPIPSEEVTKERSHTSAQHT